MTSKYWITTYKAIKNVLLVLLAVSVHLWESGLFLSLSEARILELQPDHRRGNENLLNIEWHRKATDHLASPENVKSEMMSKRCNIAAWKLKLSILFCLSDSTVTYSILRRLHENLTVITALSVTVLVTGVQKLYLNFNVLKIERNTDHSILKCSIFKQVKLARLKNGQNRFRKVH